MTNLEKFPEVFTKNLSVTLDTSEIENEYEDIKILNSDGSGSSENLEGANK